MKQLSGIKAKNGKGKIKCIREGEIYMGKGMTFRIRISWQKKYDIWLFYVICTCIIKQNLCIFLYLLGM